LPESRTLIRPHAPPPQNAADYNAPPAVIAEGFRSPSFPSVALVPTVADTECPA